MARTLLETYRSQLEVADAFVSNTFKGRRMSDKTKLTTAVVLDNTNRFMTEAMNHTFSTDRSALGDFKKFCLNLTNIAVPSLIANDLVIVHPMTSLSGAVTYLKYVSGNEKGDIKPGDTFNSVFGLGNVNEARQNFTAPVTIETASEKSQGKLMFAPTQDGRFGVSEKGERRDVKVTKADGTSAYGQVQEAGNVSFGNIKLESGSIENGDRIAYFSKEYQMEKTPAQEIPTIRPELNAITLRAHARRIAIQYDQITAWQAKTDYGFSLDKQLAEQAVGELTFEIDCELVDMLAKGAKEITTEEELEQLTWSKTLPIGVSMRDHYVSFLVTIEKAKTIIYNRTKRFAPTYMVVAPDLIPVMSAIDSFKQVEKPKMNGPYKAGTISGLDVYVTPQLTNGEYFLGLNGSDMMSSAAVYAPYMAIVPTMLLGYADGAQSQGFSTWYDAQLLNKNLLVRGRVVE